MEAINYERMQIEALVTRREGMVADNKIKESRGESLAYSGEDFFELETNLYNLLTFC